MFGLSDAAWRALVLLAESLAPWAVPVDTAGAASMGPAIVRLVLALAVYALATWGIRAASSRYPGAAALSALTLFAAPVVSAVCNGERGPLARGMWVMAPIAWSAIAAIVAGPVADAVKMGEGARTRFVAGAVAIALGVGSVAAGGAKLGSRSAMWRSALAADPGDAAAAIAVAKLDDDENQRGAGLEVLFTCVHVRPNSCACAEAAAGAAVDEGRYQEARRVIEAPSACADSARRAGLHAEALIGTNALDEGAREAERGLLKDPRDAHAVYARAWLASLRGRPADARPDAERAVALGRGIPAELLLGTFLYGAGDLAGADVEFKRVLSENPTSVQATYDRALIADRQSRYHDAREGYLRALQLEPKNADARYNLVLLTHAHGASMEAKHHLDMFAAAFPGDARIPQLTQALAVPSPVKAMTFP